jgi:hypothetical protein
MREIAGSGPSAYRIAVLCSAFGLFASCGGGGSSSTGPTSSTSLPPISAEAKQLVIDHNQNTSGGGIKRWTRSPIRLAAPGFSRSEADQAVALWNGVLGSVGTTLQVVDDPGGADVVFSLDPSFPSGSCGREGAADVQGFVIVRGTGVYSTRPECTGGSAARTAIAHGLGHVLGFDGHTPSNSDIMASPLVPFRMSAVLAEAMRFIYSVAPGTRI